MRFSKVAFAFMALCVASAVAGEHWAGMAVARVGRLGHSLGPPQPGGPPPWALQVFYSTESPSVPAWAHIRPTCQLGGSGGYEVRASSPRFACPVLYLPRTALRITSNTAPEHSSRAHATAENSTCCFPAPPSDPHPPRPPPPTPPSTTAPGSGFAGKGQLLSSIGIGSKQVQVPSLNLPNITYPKLETKTVELPHGKGSLVVPSGLSKPSITKPSIGSKSIDVPTFNFSAIPFKKLNYPTLQFPNITKPKLDYKKVDLPHGKGSIAVPTVKKGSISGSIVNMKSIDVPDFKSYADKIVASIPSIPMKKVDIPTLNGLPNVTLPAFGTKNLDLPHGKGSLEVPTLSKPSVSVPFGSKSVEVPDLKAMGPNITFPSLGSKKVDVPTLQLPNITYPKLETKKVDLPHGKGSLTVPSGMTKGSISGSIVGSKTIDVPTVTISHPKLGRKML